jgi:hypothetical protein
LALAGTGGCAAPPAVAAQASTSPTAAHTQQVASASDVAWPPPVALSRSEYDHRLFQAFALCEMFDLGRLDGRWTVSSPSPGVSAPEVWICDGHIRWRHENGLVNDICITRIAKVPNGLNCEAAWHEDWHEPGDAGGLYVRLREVDGRLIVDASSWDVEPTQFSPFFTLTRASPESGHQSCPFE